MGLKVLIHSMVLVISSPNFIFIKMVTNYLNNYFLKERVYVHKFLRWLYRRYVIEK